MAGTNGVMSIVGRRKPIVLKSETITYTIEHEDGETVALAGYKKGPGCPLPIVLEVDEALAVVSENEPTEDDRATMSSRRYLAKLMFAERTLRRMMLQAVIPGLSLEDANIMATDEGPWKDILVELEWRQPDDVLEAAAEDDADPEAAGLAALTGQPDSTDGSTVTGMTPSSQA